MFSRNLWWRQEWNLDQIVVPQNHSWLAATRWILLLLKPWWMNVLALVTLGRKVFLFCVLAEMWYIYLNWTSVLCLSVLLSHQCFYCTFFHRSFKSVCAKAELIRHDVLFLVTLRTPDHIAWYNNQQNQSNASTKCFHDKSTCQNSLSPQHAEQCGVEPLETFLTSAHHLFLTVTFIKQIHGVVKH